MKRLLLFALTALLLSPEVRAHDHISIGFFYSSLDSYGEWIAVDGGYFAWRPLAVLTDWRPYTVGRWVWTQDGWYWYSAEPWGWATYHYGRWYYDDSYGWLWIPGYEWAPAWVEWRVGGPCIGWAPLGPFAIFDIHFGVYYHTTWVTPSSWWNFVDCRYMASSSVHPHLYRREYNHRYLGSTRGAGNVRISGGRVAVQGPARDDVELRGRIRVQTVDVVDGSKPEERLVRGTQNERIKVFRPPVERRPEDDRQRPSRVREEDRTAAIAPEHLLRRPQEPLRPQDRNDRKTGRGDGVDHDGPGEGASRPSSSGREQRKDSFRREEHPEPIPEPHGREWTRKGTGAKEISRPETKERYDPSGSPQRWVAREVSPERAVKRDDRVGKAGLTTEGKRMPAEAKPLPRTSDRRK